MLVCRPEPKSFGIQAKSSVRQARNQTKLLQRLGEPDDDRLLNRPLADRLSYDAERNTLFLGLDGYRVHTDADVEVIRTAILELFHRVGHRFSAVINYNSSDIAFHMADKWFSMAADSAPATITPRVTPRAHSCA